MKKWILLDFFSEPLVKRFLMRAVLVICGLMVVSFFTYRWWYEEEKVKADFMRQMKGSYAEYNDTYKTELAYPIRTINAVRGKLVGQWEIKVNCDCDPLRLWDCKHKRFNVMYDLENGKGHKLVIWDK